jgi:hypothetical protein
MPKQIDRRKGSYHTHKRGKRDKAQIVRGDNAIIDFQHRTHRNWENASATVSVGATK